MPENAGKANVKTNELDRPQPHNLDAERAVLASMLREPTPCVDLAVEALRSDKVFYSPAHRAIFLAICKVHDSAGMSVDLISAAHQLEREGKLEDVGGEVYLAELYNSIATTANIESWTKIVRDFSVLRNMIGVCSESVEKCYDAGDDVAELVDDIESNIYEVRNRTEQSEIVELSSSIKTTFGELMKIQNKEVEVGIPSGFPDLDHLIVGFKPGEMFVLAARPSIGKTTLALNFVRNIALNERRPRSVAFFSLEMTAEQIARRLLCTEAKISESAFYEGKIGNKEIRELTKAVETYRNASIFIDPTAGLTIAELRAKARRLKKTHNIEMVAIDYLQLMRAGARTESRQQEVADISSGIKQLAKELNVPVLVLAQLNRETEKVAGGSVRPKLSNLRESGAIEQDADIVTFLHRDRDAAKEGAIERAGAEGLEALLIVEKNRNGKTGLVNLAFYPERMMFACKQRFSRDDEPPERE